MKRQIVAALVVLMGAVLVLHAETPVAADRQATLKHLEESRDALVAASEDFLFGLITEQVMKTEKMAEPLPNVEESEKQLLGFLVDRSRKFQAPEPLRPTNRFETPEKAMEHFLESRARTIELLKSTPDLRLYAMEAPGGVKRDAQQWLLFVSGHTVRHTLQLKEVKAHANFPTE